MSILLFVKISKSDLFGESVARWICLLQRTVFENENMSRRELLTSAQREALLAFPREEAELLRYYIFNTHDLAVIRRR
jgi:hypothetical protein